MSSEISVKSWFATGWRTYRQQPRVLLIGSVLVLLVSVPFYVVPQMSFGSVIMWGFITFVLPVFMTGFSFFYLRAVRGERAQLNDLLAGFRQFGRVCLTALLVELLVSGGLILLIIPGLVWELKYTFSALTALDQRLKPVEAIRFSARMTQGHKWQMLLGIVLGLLISLPALPGFLGVFRDNSLQIDRSHLWNTQFVIAMLWSTLVSPWLSATTVSAYESLRQQAEHQPSVVVTRRTWVPAYIGGLVLLFNMISTFREPHATQKLAQQSERSRAERQTRIERKEPVLYLPFDGTTADVGPYRSPIEATGTPVSFEPGIRNQAGLFDGNSFLDSHIYLNAQKRVSLTEGATLEVWFKRTAGPHGSGGQTLVRVSGGGGNLSLGLSDKRELRGRLGQIIGFSDKNAGVISHGRSIPIDQWVHAALAYDVRARTLRLFMNGTLVDEAREVPISSHWYPISLGVGAWASPTSGSFKGWIDECKVYEFPRTSEEIAESAKVIPSSSG